MYKMDTYDVSPETYLKALILTHGVIFSDAALTKANNDLAKKQNGVYNLPKGGSLCRPQELHLVALDFYETVVSCVCAYDDKDAVMIDVDTQGNIISFYNCNQITGIDIRFVKTPDYYNEKLSNGQHVREYVTACGYDELNILPWKGCAISKGCKFCGVNTVSLKKSFDSITAFSLSNNPTLWEECKAHYLKQLKVAISIAMKDDCYAKHAHVIIISGNLSEDKLDLQAEIYSEIASAIKPLVEHIATEGIVAVLTPPQSTSKLVEMKRAGVDIVVFNLEVGNEPWFTKYCPGKADLGRDFFIERLIEAVKIFGVGNVWSNFVLGLEPVDDLLSLCHNFAKYGIICGANILHIDEGNRLDCSVPQVQDVLKFYCGLSKIYKEFDYKPFYCSNALRTSLINEVYDRRVS